MMLRLPSLPVSTVPLKPLTKPGKFNGLARHSQEHR
jgi:hypothetical protein